MKSLKAIGQLVRDTLHRFVRFFFHPIWGYSPSQILKAVQRDWEGPVFTGARTILGEMAKQNTRVMVYTFSEKDEPFLELECTARLPKPNPAVRGDRKAGVPCTGVVRPEIKKETDNGK